MKDRHSSYPVLTEEMKKSTPNKECLSLIPDELVREFKAFVLDKGEKAVTIAAVDPDNQTLRRFTADRFGDAVSWFRASDEDIANVLRNYPRDFKAEITSLMEKNVGTNGYTTAVVERLIQYAIQENASDVHIEPTKNETVVRFRVDGILHKVLSFPKDTHQPIVARLKIIANLKIDEYRRPQDGRIEPEGLSNTSLRISTVPTLYGEKVALRLLDDSHENFDVARLGFSKEQVEILRRNIEKPFGMVVTSGPTGAGKTTTLYALMNLLEREGINISTLEDPIEYTLEQANQIQVNPRVGLTFTSGLRSLLRQDPDVIMVGEIRDTDTVGMAANAALTGHLVFTTIHTNDASSVLTRFLEMEVEDFVVSTIINLVIAQRLVRKVCDGCGKAEKISPAILKKIEERADVVSELSSRGMSINSLKTKKFRSGKGCDFCLGTGYRDRIGIFELLEPNQKMCDLVLEHASADKIRAVARESGLRDIISDGIGKILEGKTTFEEVLRTTRVA